MALAPAQVPEHLRSFAVSISCITRARSLATVVRLRVLEGGGPLAGTDERIAEARSSPACCWAEMKKIA
ncbi:hypothetical protein R75461_07268 [Paraburkholderia nemoris]|nr:hypothetical protein R75461_07268 [Paraburkholderia nemoris]